MNSSNTIFNKISLLRQKVKAESLSLHSAGRNHRLGLELLTMLKEDLDHIGAEGLHQLQRTWELKHRVWTSEAVLRRTLYR